jgi:DMSO/TMAO reductase YedYZ molybdopterin-dependent catalytic subunit
MSAAGGLGELLAGMAGRRTNVLLGVLVVTAMGTGVLAFALGSPPAVVVVVLHGLTGLGIVLTTPWKWRIAEHGMAARRPSSTWPSVLLGAVTVVTILSGVLLTAGLVRRYGSLDAMLVHVVAAVAVAVLTGWHVARRGHVPRRRDLTRRNLLRAGVLLGGAGVAFGALEGGYRLAGLAGARRRFTGSHEQGSHRPSAMPSIIWLTDPRPQIAAAQWRLEVADGRAVQTHDHAALAAYDDRITATIDCTVGWYAEQAWRGARLDRLLDVPATANSVVVRSVTGYTRRFPVTDVPHLLLATGYGEQPLDARHGFPLRLVAPGRRGFWWVKWVERIEISEAPWWWQPPFPLQ